jgi:antitoxin HicB
MKDLKYYTELPYTVVLRRDEEGDFVARIDELPGCSAHGKTRSEALDNLEESKELWIRDCIESGHPIPEPTVEEPLPSGKWVQRVPRSLHKKLSSLAKRQAVSLNQLVTSLLAEAVGARTVLEGTKETRIDLQVAHSRFIEEEGAHDWSIREAWPQSAPRTRTKYLALLRCWQRKKLAQHVTSKAKVKHAHEEAYKIS